MLQNTMVSMVDVAVVDHTQQERVEQEVRVEMEVLLVQMMDTIELVEVEGIQLMVQQVSQVDMVVQEHLIQ